MLALGSVRKQPGSSMTPWISKVFSISWFSRHRKQTLSKRCHYSVEMQSSRKLACDSISNCSGAFELCYECGKGANKKCLYTETESHS